MAFWAVRLEKDQCGGHHLCLDYFWPSPDPGSQVTDRPPLSSESVARKPPKFFMQMLPPSSPQCLQHPQHPPGPSARRCGHPRKRRPLPGAGESQVCCCSAMKCPSQGCFRHFSLYVHKLLHYWAFPFTFIWACYPSPRQGSKIWNNYLRNNEAYKTCIP